MSEKAFKTGERVYVWLVPEDVSMGVYLYRTWGGNIVVSVQGRRVTVNCNDVMSEDEYVAAHIATYLANAGKCSPKCRRFRKSTECYSPQAQSDFCANYEPRKDELYL